MAFKKLSSPPLHASSRLELIWISVQCGHNRSLVIGCAYRPPLYEGIKLDLEVLELSIKKFLSEGKQVILCGDLNCDLLRPDLPQVRSMLSLINNVDMHQCVREPTRITHSSSTLIDIVLVSDPSLVKECFSHDCIVSDHNFVVVKMQVRRAKVKPKLITFRRWNGIDFASFKSDLYAISWAPVFCTSNPDEAWRIWTERVVPVLDRHAPLVTAKTKHKAGFGVSADTRNLIRLTAAQLRTYRCSGALSDLALYKSMRRQVRGAISLERRLLFETSVKMNRSSRDTWNLINSTLGKSKLTQPLDRNTARSFNEFFCSVGADIQASVKVTACLKDISYGPPRVLSTRFDLRPATGTEL